MKEEYGRGEEEEPQIRTLMARWEMSYFGEAEVCRGEEGER